MKRQLFAVALILVGSTGLPLAQQATTTEAPLVLSHDEMEQFLLKAEVVARKGVSKGVTDTIRATLSDGRIKHEAQIQTVDIQKSVFEAGKATELNFKDTYRFNIGAYRLARLLGLNNVPMSVKRRYNGKDGAMTWWIDDVQFDEGGRLKEKNILGPKPEQTSKHVHVMRVFDELIQNRDRNQGNMLWTKDWTLWMIDHTRAFRLSKDLMKPDQLTRCERSLLDGMRKLTLEMLTTAMGDVMFKDELQAVIDRRDKLVKLFDERIATRGEPAVLFTM
jgi:hypothetical protein